jgi:hypothetical protein
MKQIKYQIGKVFFNIIISLLGIVRVNSDDTTKLKIDNMVCNSIKNTNR